MEDITWYTREIEKLHKKGNYEDISSLLTDLCNTLVTLEQLQKTDIAKTVYQLLKSCPVASVRKTAKDILSKWKRMYSVPYHKKIKNTSQVHDCDLRDRVKSEISEPCTSQHLGQEVNNSESIQNIGVWNDISVQEMRDKNSTTLSVQSSEGTTSKETQDCGSREVTDGIKASYTGKEESRIASTIPAQDCSSANSTALRAKCIGLLLQALTPDEKTHNLESTNQLSTLAHAVENHIYRLHGHNQPKYKSCVRSKYANLKNPKNLHLRQGLLKGTLTAEAFAQMSAEEMAGEELRRMREEYTAASIGEHQLPQRLEGTPTSKVRCHRCGGMNCSVTQVSRGTLFLPSWVRSGNTDEDPMTFITCSRCGEQWYHSRWVCL